MYDDNIAVVEFGRKIRYYYMFQPQIYEYFASALREKLGLDPQDIDILLFNDGKDKVLEKYSA